MRLAIIALCALVFHPLWADGIQLSTSRRAFYAEQNATFTVQLQAEARQASALHVRLSHDQRTLWQTSYATADAVSIECRMPPLNEGVVLPLTLQLTAENDHNEVLASHDFPLYIFSRKLAANLHAALSEIGIAVYAPGADSLGTQLTEHGIPVQVVKGIQDVKAGWLICAGLDFNRRPSLFGELAEAAQHGKNILILPPIAGSCAWDSTPYKSVLFASPAHLKQIDKRLDTADWSMAAPTIAAYAGLGTRRSAVMLNFTTEPAPWAWVEASTSAGRLIVCGFDMAAHLDENPSSLRLLLSLLLPPTPTMEATP